MTATALPWKEYESSHLAECAKCPLKDCSPGISGHFHLLVKKTLAMLTLSLATQGDRRPWKNRTSRTHRRL